MKKFIVKVTILMGIVAALLYAMAGFSRPNHHYLNTVNDFNALVDEGKDIDVAIYGSSHAYCSYNPRIIDSIAKVRSFNFGNDAQKLVVTKYILKETLKDISPKLVVIDVYPASVNNPEGERDYSFQTISYDCFGISSYKISSALEVFPKEKAVEVIFPGLKRKEYRYNFSFSNNRSYTYPLQAKANSYRGFVGFDLKPKEELKLPKGSFKELNDNVGSTNEGYNKFTINEGDDIIKFIELAKSGQAKVLFVVAPYYAAFEPKGNYAGFHNYLKKLCEENGANLLDFNLEWKSIGLTSNDFKDKGHLSLKGSTKVSKYLGSYIKHNYDIPSRLEDPSWVSEQPKDMNTYLYEDYKTSSRAMGVDISKDVRIESFAIIEIQGLKKLVVEVGDQVTDSIVTKYKWGFHTYVDETDRDKLMAYSKAKKRSYDAWDFNPKITEVNGKKFVIKTLNTKINSFTKIKMFLYDRDGYKGVRGETIEIDNVKVTQ